MAKAKRRPDQVRRDRVVVADMYLSGSTQQTIVEYINDKRDYSLSRQQISHDLKVIRQQWLQSSLRDFDAAKAEELAKIDRLEVEYWRSWERSKKSFTSKTTRAKLVDEELGRVDQVNRTEERTGDPRFLAGVQWCIDKRCKIFGLDAPSSLKVDLDVSWQREIKDLYDQKLISVADIIDELGAEVAGQFFEAMNIEVEPQLVIEHREDDGQ